MKDIITVNGYDYDLPIAYDHVKPTIKEEHIPKFDSWWETKLKSGDKWHRYLLDCKEYDNVQEKLDSGEMKLYTAEIRKEMTVLAKDYRSANVFAHDKWGYDVDIEVYE
jgi:hypothetical protein